MRTVTYNDLSYTFIVNLIRDFSFWYIVLAVVDMLLIGSRVSIQSHQSGLICHPRRFSNAAWIWKFVVDCSSFSFGMYLLQTNFSKDVCFSYSFKTFERCFFLCLECEIDDKEINESVASVNRNLSYII